MDISWPRAPPVGAPAGACAWARGCARTLPLVGEGTPEGTLRPKALIPLGLRQIHTLIQPRGMARGGHRHIPKGVEGISPMGYTLVRWCDGADKALFLFFRSQSTP
jgi:hypothetical protein